MLTEVKAYSSWPSASTLLLSDTGRAETDFVQIRNIEGLDPVKASVNTSLLGTGDGEAYTGSSIPKRNIVFTIHPNPDWKTWSHETLRRLLYLYFMPKQLVRLVFYDDLIVPVEIHGIVESFEDNLFSEDPEILVSIICPDPYFTALEPEIVSGNSIRPGGLTTEVPYNGTVETGFYVKISFSSGSTPTYVKIQVGDPNISYFAVDSSPLVDSSKYFEMTCLQSKKTIQNVTIASGLFTNLLSKIRMNSVWPVLKPGINDFSIVTDVGIQTWELRYYERFGGL